MTGETNIWIDGVSTDALPLPDRAFAYGDGLFETLLLRGEQPLLLEYHLQRLQAGLQRLRFPDCLDSVRDYLAQAAAAPGATAPGATAPGATPFRVLRLAVSRGAGPRGYAPPADCQPRVIISVSTLLDDPAQLPAPARLGETAVRWGRQPLLAGLKHLNRLEQVLAAADCDPRRCDEVLMLDQSGAPLSVSAGNLFLVAGKRLLTPVLNEAGIAGTRRRLILERLAAACGLPVTESRLELSQLLGADELFYCNTVVGLRPVAAFRDRRWSRHPVTRSLHAAYVEYLQEGAA
ncbi:aminodeoxychorismate lyase [Haliea sp. E1-2-M8]|uniref:aminodeoxychorismate lyase n=1 Tax=Haliea sp. E1-2-M8 TaxID=3064706 RepID=UPI00272002A7|nr:aminodeoxychorismate lyase [Haliea sp. E1-2-M8]MDO8862326.1 aminodeoxychorismate lyase [Haliea sp. E1-2-M8]